MLIFSLCVLHVWKQDQLTLGIKLGIVLTATTLIIAYCTQETESEVNKVID